MVKRFILKVIGIMLAVCFLLTIKNVDFEGIISLVDNTPITLDTLEKLNEEHLLGNFVDTKLTEEIWTTGGVKEKSTALVVKLFGFIPIKKTEVIVCDEEQVYLGGVPLGFSVSTKGVIVVGSKKSANTTHLAEILKDIPDEYDTNMAEKYLYKYDGMVEFVYSPEILTTIGMSSPKIICKICS